MNISNLLDLCNRYSGCAPEYFPEPIPNNKLKNARASMNIDSTTRVTALIDLTLFGGAAESILITENGLNWKTKDLGPESMTWDQLRQCTPEEKDTLLTKIIEFDNGAKIDLSGSRQFSVRDNHLFLQLVNDLVLFAQENYNAETQKKITHDNSGMEPISDHGLIECEFCQGLNKPDVTFCKHCGIKLRG